MQNGRVMLGERDQRLVAAGWIVTDPVFSFEIVGVWVFILTERVLGDGTGWNR